MATASPVSSIPEIIMNALVDNDTYLFDDEHTVKAVIDGHQYDVTLGCDKNKKWRCAVRALNESPTNEVPVVKMSQLQRWASVRNIEKQVKSLLKVKGFAAHGETTKLKAFCGKHPSAIELWDEFFRTPLIISAAFGKKGTVSMLLESGAEVDAVDDQKSSALIWAASFGERKCLELLINGGADLNKSNIRGNTALHHAVLREHWGCVKLLIEHRADMTIQNLNMASPMELCLSQHYKQDIFEMMLESSMSLVNFDAAKQFRLGAIAANTGNIRALKAMNSRGVLLSNMLGKFGSEDFKFTILTQAAMSNQPKVVKWLLNNGADKAICDANGKRAYDYATKKVKRDCPELIDEGVAFSSEEENLSVRSQ
ncbi:ankyrin repeat domain-containing protein [Parashewanella curva]|uniref:Ankyrin repeat domain-containing protein n=1 Tax=Parashewanella curva TaxID=2338552 RepID=A0A3L8Q2G5_9GAMM|nr:ankyrin repeat domain-containing protein [Parashewanella curva]RLV61720.1 ankyrin repeat domain-containing protein [Parashewanella curva]